MNRIIRIAAALALAVGLATGALAAQGAAISGEVKKIDEGAGKITLKHGPGKNLGMDEPMTMIYRVKDPAVLKQVKVGDKVTFEAEEATSGYTVTPDGEGEVGPLPPSADIGPRRFHKSWPGSSRPSTPSAGQAGHDDCLPARWPKYPGQPPCRTLY
ncbi:Cu/Ag efflux protein CusF [Bradyrhizobium sp. GM2.4]